VPSVVVHSTPHLPVLDFIGLAFMTCCLVSFVSSSGSVLQLPPSYTLCILLRREIHLFIAGRCN
jgi:hypothetical protein